MGDLRSKFMEIYFVLKAELLNDPAFEFTDTSRHWVDHMVDYNVPTGKLNRGISVIDSYKLLFGGKELSDEEFFLASALGWCIEWLQAYLLVLDDIEDNSHLRRGQPCWFRLPQIGMVAVNDGIVLRNHIWRILKNHFRGKPYYVDLLDLFNEVEFQTISGQMIDLITTLDGEEGEKDLSKYSLPLHRRIVQFKTSYYSFYLPVACALLMAGENLENHIDVKNTLVDMGIYYQVQDDYLDSFGDPEVVGKVGTDIEDFKCSWLVVKALECCNDEQKKLLYENYGKADQACVAKVKELYNALDLQAVFTQYESESHEKLIKSIEAHPSKAVQAVLKSFLAKIYKRQNSLGYNMNMGSVDRAASDDQISSLSSWRYKQVDTNSELDANSNSTSANKEDPECCICLAKYREKEEVRQLPCSHLFHLKYVDQWFRIISCCPLCIQELDRYKNKNM